MRFFLILLAMSLIPGMANAQSNMNFKGELQRMSEEQKANYRNDAIRAPKVKVSQAVLAEVNLPSIRTQKDLTVANVSAHIGHYLSVLNDEKNKKYMETDKIGAIDRLAFLSIGASPVRNNSKIISDVFDALNRYRAYTYKESYDYRLQAINAMAFVAAANTNVRHYTSAGTIGSNAINIFKHIIKTDDNYERRRAAAVALGVIRTKESVSAIAECINHIGKTIVAYDIYGLGPTYEDSFAFDENGNMYEVKGSDEGKGSIIVSLMLALDASIKSSNNIYGSRVPQKDEVSAHALNFLTTYAGLKSGYTSFNKKMKQSLAPYGGSHISYLAALYLASQYQGVVSSFVLKRPYNEYQPTRTVYEEQSASALQLINIYWHGNGYESKYKCNTRKAFYSTYRIITVNHPMWNGEILAKGAQRSVTPGQWDGCYKSNVNEITKEMMWFIAHQAIGGYVDGRLAKGLARTVYRFAKTRKMATIGVKAVIKGQDLYSKYSDVNSYLDESKKIIGIAAQ